MTRHVPPIRSASIHDRINREKLLFNPAKIVPMMDIHYGVIAQSKRSILHFAMNAFNISASNVGKAKVEQGRNVVFVAQVADLSDELRQDALATVTSHIAFRAATVPMGTAGTDDINEALHEVCKSIENGQGVIGCRRLGDIIDDYETALHDAGLTMLGRLSAIAGRGDAVLGFWQGLNAMKSWGSHITPNRMNFDPSDGGGPRPRRQTTWRPWGNLRPQGA